MNNTVMSPAHTLSSKAPAYGAPMWKNMAASTTLRTASATAARNRSRRCTARTPQTTITTRPAMTNPSMKKHPLRALQGGICICDEPSRDEDRCRPHVHVGWPSIPLAVKYIGNNDYVSRLCEPRRDGLPTEAMRQATTVAFACQLGFFSGHGGPHRAHRAGVPRRPPHSRSSRVVCRRRLREPRCRWSHGAHVRPFAPWFRAKAMPAVTPCRRPCVCAHSRSSICS